MRHLTGADSITTRNQGNEVRRWRHLEMTSTVNPDSPDWCLLAMEGKLAPSWISSASRAVGTD